MYNGQIIKELLVKRNLTNKELLNYLGIECNSSLSQLTTGNPSVKKLEKVADFFGVSMDVFFVRDSFKPERNSSMSENKMLKDKILLLEKLLQEKDRNITLLEQLNKYMSETLSGQNK